MERDRRKTPLRVLSLDGCGVRGLSELLVLKHLMHRIQPLRGSKKLPKPCDFFDIIGGSSTGGLIAILLGRLELDIDKCVEFYCSLMRDLFPDRQETWFTKTFIYEQSSNEKAWFNAQTLESRIKELIQSVFGSDQENIPFEHQDSKCKVFVCTTRASNGGSAVLRSYHSRLQPPVSCTVWEAVRATMAMPPFFEPISIGPLGCLYADGAVRNNNPIWVAVEEVRKEFAHDSLACLVSVGTGRLPVRSIGTSTADLWQACFSIVLDTETTARLFMKEYKPLWDQGRYFRFNVQQGLQNAGFDEFSPTVLDLIDAATQDYLDDRDDDITRCSEMLRRPTHPSKRPNVDTNIESNRDVLIWLDALEEYELLWRFFSEDPDTTDTFAESDFMKHCSLRFPDTCEWITIQEQFSAWTKRPNTGHCFLHGIPGSGKSVLAAFVGKWLRLAQHEIPTIVFFCDSKDERKSSADNFFRNAIVQLIHFYPHLVNDLALELGRTGRKKVASWAHLKSIFVRFLREIGKVYIVIDALDELNALGQDVVSETISNLGASLLGESVIKAFLTSRTRADVLAKVSFCEHNIILQRGPLDNDIRIFISLSVDRNEELRAMFGGNPTFIRELKETLLARSEGMFLLPKLLLQELKAKETMDDMRQVLRNIPDTLSQYYVQFIQRIDTSRKDFALKVFSWLACALRPLSLEELKIALEIQSRIQRPNKRYEVANLKFSIEKACSCLVIIQKNKVQLAHSSVKRFLLDPGLVDNSERSSEYLFEIAAVHEDMALVSLEYLSQSVFSTPISCNRRFSGREVGSLKVEYPLMMYSCQFWHTHVGLSRRRSPRLLERLAHFLCAVNCRSYIELVFLYWNFPNVTMEDTSNTLLSWVSKEPISDEEAFVFNWARDLWDINLELSGLLEAFPSEIHFLADLLPSTAIHDPRRVQRLVARVPGNFGDASQARELLIQAEIGASGQRVASKSDRFLLTESAMIDWESTMSTPRRFLQNIGIRWEVHVQNLQTRKRYSRYSLALCRREGICCSVAIASNDEHVAVSWPEYQDDNATLPLKIKTYAWTLRWDESRSPVWRKWDWTDIQYGADYTRAAGFRRTKNSIAFTTDSEVLATPGGFYDVSSGSLAFPPSLFSDTEVSGLTFSSNAEFVWGMKRDKELVIYQRDSDKISVMKPTDSRFCEVLAVSPDGGSAIVFVLQEAQPQDSLKLCLVTRQPGNHGYILDDLYHFSDSGNELLIHEHWDYIRAFYSSGGQIHISDNGKAIIGLPSPEQDYVALVFTLLSHKPTRYSEAKLITLKPPEGSFLLSVRFQRGTADLYGLTSQAIVWRFVPKDAGTTPSLATWEPPLRQESAQRKTYIVSDYCRDSKLILVDFQLGGQPKFGRAPAYNDPIRYRFEDFSLIRLMEKSQQHDRATSTMELSKMLQCYEISNHNSRHQRRFSFGSRSGKRNDLDSFFQLSECQIRQSIGRRCGFREPPWLTTHFTASDDGGVAISWSIYTCNETSTTLGNNIAIYSYLVIMSVKSGRLAVDERRVGDLLESKKIIQRNLQVTFCRKSSWVGVALNLVLSSGIEETTEWLGKSYFLAVPSLRGSEVPHSVQRSAALIDRLFHRQLETTEVGNMELISELGSALSISFSVDGEVAYVIDHMTSRLNFYSTQGTFQNRKQESWNIFGDWAVSGVHDVQISQTTLRYVVLTDDYLLGLVVVNLQDRKVQRRLLSSLWVPSLSQGTRIYVEPTATEEESGIRVIVCQTLVGDLTLDPNQTEEKYNPEVIFVSEMAMGDWIHQSF